MHTCNTEKAESGGKSEIRLHFLLFYLKKVKCLEKKWAPSLYLDYLKLCQVECSSTT